MEELVEATPVIDIVEVSVISKDDIMKQHSNFTICHLEYINDCIEQEAKKKRKKLHTLKHNLNKMYSCDEDIDVDELHQLEKEVAVLNKEIETFNYINDKYIKKTITGLTN